MIFFPLTRQDGSVIKSDRFGMEMIMIWEIKGLDRLWSGRRINLGTYKAYMKMAWVFKVFYYQ